MYELLCMVVILVFTAFTGAQAPTFRSVFLAQNRQSPAAQPSSTEIPRNSIPQNSPCADQPKSLKELTASFNKGRLPFATEVSGSWVAIGFVGDGWSANNPSLNCTGVKRGKKFEFVMVANRYSIELDAIGMTYPQTVTMEPDHRGSLQFPVDFAGDHLPVYRCRLTQRQTLACLVAIYGQGVEFKKMPVEEDQIYKVKPIC
jgi:hypothetical protein